MRRAAAGAMFAALFAAPAFALALSEIDTDGDSLVSFTEMTVLYPELTEEVFAEIDTSDDTLVDEGELAAALASGVIAEPAR